MEKPTGHEVMAVLEAPVDEAEMPVYFRTYSARNHGNLVGGDTMRIYYTRGPLRPGGPAPDRLVVMGPPEQVQLPDGPGWAQPVLWHQNWRRNYLRTTDVSSIPPAARYRHWLVLKSP